MKDSKPSEQKENPGSVLYSETNTPLRPRPAQKVDFPVDWRRRLGTNFRKLSWPKGEPRRKLLQILRIFWKAEALETIIIIDDVMGV